MVYRRGDSLVGSSSGSAFHWVISIGWLGSIKNGSAELNIKLTNEIESEREMIVELSFTIPLPLVPNITSVMLSLLIILILILMTCVV